jgi:hypothetical protein
VVCLAAYAAGQGFRKKTSGPTTPATVQKQVAAGVSLFVCLHFLAKPEVEITRVLGPHSGSGGESFCLFTFLCFHKSVRLTTLAIVQKQVAAGVRIFVCLHSLLNQRRNLQKF